MQAVLFIGIPASGKSSFYQERFFNTHIRINLDMLKTRHREKLLTMACIQAKQTFVSDNTNPTVEVRARTIQPAKSAGFTVIGYYFQAALEEALRRNATRPQPIPQVGIFDIHRRLQRPTYDEGFDQLFYVRIEADQFKVEAWRDEI